MRSDLSVKTITRLLHADRLGKPEHGALLKPVHVAAAYGYDSAEQLAAVFQGREPGHLYSRQATPTTQALEARLTLLESGIGTISFATGMAAIVAIFMTLLKKGDHLVASQFLFGNTASVLQTLDALGVEVTLVDATETDHVAQALRPNTRMVFVESIANPRTQVANLAGIGTLCERHKLVYVLDATLSTPALLQGKAVGASLVVHSLSKSLCGHGNALGGSVTDTGLFNWAAYPNITPAYRSGSSALWGLTQIRKKGLRDMGGALSAEHAHRIATGLETLELRLRACCDNALHLAEWLANQPQVARVHYPGLPKHPQHTRARTLFGGKHFGSLLSFELQDGIDPFAMLNALRWVVRSTHLGDNRTLAIPVAQTIFWEVGPEVRKAMGIADGLVRVSVGIESIIDLQADFAQALAVASGAARLGHAGASGEDAPPTAILDLPEPAAPDSRPAQ